jgi:Arc/MetJ family transcription regulator
VGSNPVKAAKAGLVAEWRLGCVYLAIEVHIMRTNIVIDDKLMRDTLRATGIKTKREAVEEGLRSLLRLKRQARIRRLRGKLNWQGDLDVMRSDS